MNKYLRFSVPSNKRGGIIGFILIIILVVIIALNYSKIDGFVGKVIYQNDVANVTRVVDGDTVELQDGVKVRMLGINTPEKKEVYHDEAMNYLKERVEGRQVVLRKGTQDKDLYGRELRFIFLNDENINIELIKGGFANAYFPSKDKMYYDEFEAAWQQCVVNNINLCERSIDVCAACIKLDELDDKNEIAKFSNGCSSDCDLNGWTIKDEGRKKFAFKDFKVNAGTSFSVKVGDGEDSQQVLYWKGQDYVWTESGDTLYLRDSKNKLVLYNNY